MYVLEGSIMPRAEVAKGAGAWASLQTVALYKTFANDHNIHLKNYAPVACVQGCGLSLESAVAIQCLTLVTEGLGLSMDR